MDVAPLIDNIVRQTMILIAQLATNAGVRAPLAHIANQIFMDLTTELQGQGLGRKVIADMFGLTLRSYHAKVRRLKESSRDSGESLWMAVFKLIVDRKEISRIELLKTFKDAPPESIKAVLNDLLQSGTITKSGRSDQAIYSYTNDRDTSLLSASAAVERAANLLWITLYRQENPTRHELAAATMISEELLDDALDMLIADGRVERVVQPGGQIRYHSSECVIPMGDPAGWEAAVFDHFQAMVVALTIKLGRGPARAAMRDAIGGSTFGFEVWDGHPMQAEVIQLLSEIRERCSGLRAKVDAFNATQKIPEDFQRVVFYCGQSVTEDNLYGQYPEADDGETREDNDDSDADE